jgi:RNA polymerase sigma factor (sigma-70 family)
VPDSDEDSGRERFGALYEENYHRLLGYALRRVGDAEAADAVAEAFLVAWRRLDEVPPGDAAKLWLYGVTQRVLANSARGRRRRERLAERLRADVTATASSQTCGSEDRVAIAFARLRADDRELLALVAWEGLDAAEIATVCGRSVNAIRIRLHRARRRFLRELERVRAEPPEAAAIADHRPGADRGSIDFTRREELL